MKQSSSVENIRLYLPLIGFVVPTVIIGYGFVIPRSCIAGINELTIGFGTTILGSIVACLAGQRAIVPQKGMCETVAQVPRHASAEPPGGITPWARG